MSTFKLILFSQLFFMSNFCLSSIVDTNIETKKILEVDGEYYCTSSDELNNIDEVIGISAKNYFYLSGDLNIKTQLIFQNVEIIGSVITRDGKAKSKPIISGPVDYKNATIKDCLITGKTPQNKKPVDKTE